MNRKGNTEVVTEDKDVVDDMKWHDMIWYWKREERWKKKEGWLVGGDGGFVVSFVVRYWYWFIIKCEIINSFKIIIQ